MIGKFNRTFGPVCVWISYVGLIILITALFVPLYMGVMVTCHIPEQVSLSYHDTLQAYLHVLNGLLNPFASDFIVPHFTLSAQAHHHFIEVRHLFMGLEAILVVLVPYSVMYGRRQWMEKWWYTWEMRLKQWRLYPLPLLIMLPLGFQPLFVLFHQLIFNNKDWIFNPKQDPIILLFPVAFFLCCTLMMVILYYGGIFYALHQLKRKEEEDEKRNGNFRENESKSKN